MDRKALAACAALLLPLIAAATSGCSERSAGPQSAATRAAAPGLLKVPSGSPHSWKRLDQPAIVTAATSATSQDDLLAQADSQEDIDVARDIACDVDRDVARNEAQIDARAVAEAVADETRQQNADEPAPELSDPAALDRSSSTLRLRTPGVQAPATTDESEQPRIAFIVTADDETPSHDDAAESSDELSTGDDDEPIDADAVEAEGDTVTPAAPRTVPVVMPETRRVATRPTEASPVTPTEPAEVEADAEIEADEASPRAEDAVEVVADVPSPENVEFRGDDAPAPIEPQQSGHDKHYPAPMGEAAQQAPPQAPAPQRTELPWAKANPRTPEMTAVIERADQRVRHGFQLADRGAHYSARAEFTAALQLIAQANDAQQNTRMYGRALTSGLTALKESSGFLRQHASKGDVDIARIVATHKTPILKQVDVEQFTPMLAAQRYFTYAQEQLSAAAAREATGSMALFGLAKIVIANSGQSSSRTLEATAQATTLYQAALMADVNNFLAANELAVLLAESGELRRARELLSHSVGISPRAVTWRNLAIVHARLGEPQLAQAAHERAVAMRATSDAKAEAAPVVQWLDPPTFARSMNSVDGLAAPAAAPGAAGATKTTGKGAHVPTSASDPEPKTGISAWLPSLRR